MKLIYLLIVCFFTVSFIHASDGELSLQKTRRKRGSKILSSLGTGSFLICHSPRKRKVKKTQPQSYTRNDNIIKPTPNQLNQLIKSYVGDESCNMNKLIHTLDLLINQRSVALKKDNVQLQAIVSFAKNSPANLGIILDILLKI